VSASTILGQACSCGTGYSCCNGACYNPTSYICESDQLCPISNGVPDLACGTACYSLYAYSCCNGALYQKGDLANPCEAPSTNISASWDSEILWSGESTTYGPITICDWSANSFTSPSTYDLHECTNNSGPSYYTDETYYVVTFPLPSNADSYTYTASLYVDNSVGTTQTVLLSVLQSNLPSSLSVSQDVSGAYQNVKCDLFDVYDPALYSYNITIAQGYVGYITFDATAFAEWELAQGSTSLQIVVSPTYGCLCFLEGSTCSSNLFCECSDPTYHVIIDSATSPHPPYLTAHN